MSTRHPLLQVSLAVPRTCVSSQVAQDKFAHPSMCVSPTHAPLCCQQPIYGMMKVVVTCSSRDTRTVTGRAPVEAAPKAVREELHSRKRDREGQQPRSRYTSSTLPISASGAPFVMCKVLPAVAAATLEH